LVEPVLAGDHHKGLRQFVAGTFHAHPAAGHALQQGALGPGAGPVDFVGQHHLAKQGAGLEAEPSTGGIQHRNAREVCGQEVIGEMQPVELQPKAAGQGFSEGGFAHAGQVLQQQMSSGQQAGERQLDLLLFSQQHPGELAVGALQLGHGCGEVPVLVIRPRLQYRSLIWDV